MPNDVHIPRYRYFIHPCLYCIKVTKISTVFIYFAQIGRCIFGESSKKIRLPFLARKCYNDDEENPFLPLRGTDFRGHGGFLTLFVREETHNANLCK